MSHGRHVKIVGYGDEAKLGSPEGVRAFLLSCVRAVGMRPLAEPEIHDVELDLAKLNVEPFEDEGGVTGIVVLSTSHASIHTWPARKLFVFDLYSCRTFRDLPIVDALQRTFGVRRYRLTDVSDSLVPPADSESVPSL